jgi:acetoin utilization deacetylase AcuC-like enzyme
MYRLGAGSTDADWPLVHCDIISPVLEESRPQLVLVSAGFDAHERDLLASMRMTANDYTAILGSLRDVESRHGALELATEGGYELSAPAACLDASIAVLHGGCAPAIERCDEPRGARSALQACAALSPFLDFIVAGLTPFTSRTQLCRCQPR